MAVCHAILLPRPALCLLRPVFFLFPRYFGQAVSASPTATTVTSAVACASPDVADRHTSPGLMASKDTVMLPSASVVPDVGAMVMMLVGDDEKATIASCAFTPSICTVAVTVLL